MIDNNETSYKIQFTELASGFLTANQENGRRRLRISEPWLKEQECFSLNRKSSLSRDRSVLIIQTRARFFLNCVQESPTGHTCKRTCRTRPAFTLFFCYHFHYFLVLIGGKFKRLNDY